MVSGRFAGRAAELDWIRRRLRAGDGRGVVVAGEPGRGKSRLTVSIRTVANHLCGVYERLGVNDRSGLGHLLSGLG